MSLLDTLTGGKSDEASDALQRAEQYFTSIRTPTKSELTLPELQQYIEAGIMTPAQAEAYLQNSNAYSDMNVPQTGTAAQTAALNKLTEVSDAGAMGTPVEQAALENATQKMNTSVAGQRGAIEQQMAARGIPASLITAALENQTVGEDAQQAHLDAVNAAGNNYQTALNALAERGSMGNSLQGQQNAQANTVAGAANAMQQFNANNQQNNSQFNARNVQEANASNTANRQNVSNSNVSQNNQRTAYNAQLPETMFNNEIEKAQGMAGAATNYGNLEQKQGGQNAALNAGIINAVTSGANSFKPTGAAPQAQPYGPQFPGQGYGYAHGGVVDHDHSVCMAHGGICMAEGGSVPGEAPFPGDTPANDMVPIQASPGEAVIPRSSVAEHPDVVASLLGDQNSDAEIIDVQDVATLLKAMRAIRMGAA